MDRIRKFLRKLTPAQRKRVIAALTAIAKGDLDALDIKPLKGRKDWFRCRVGDVRIIFVRTKHNTHIVYEVQFRGDAYKK